MHDRGKKVGILQSNYIPWKGYFDLIARVDRFVFYDDVQYTRGDWRNRNKIKTPDGTLWLTIPCGSDIQRRICDVRLERHGWQEKHWKNIEQYYRRAKYFHQYRDFFREIYLGNHWTNLSDFNQTVIKRISRKILGVKTIFEDSRKYPSRGKKLRRLLGILDQIGDVSEYVSGPSAKAYLDEKKFVERKIKLTYMSYLDYPEYRQLYGTFRHDVSIIDLLFNEGPQAARFMKHVQ
ncbi:MAG: WbqC family protein [Candidatus Hodarchaeota archaeon]